MIMKNLFIFAVLLLPMLFFVSLASADFLVCFDDKERINYCNPAVPDRTCNSDTGCTYCMASYSEEDNCFNQGNINTCNHGPQICNNISGSISPNPPDVGVSLIGPNEGYSVLGPA